jgi:hypothetical protein
MPRNTISLQHRYRKKDATDKQSHHGSFDVQPNLQAAPCQYHGRA